MNCRRHKNNEQDATEKKEETRDAAFFYASGDMTAFVRREPRKSDPHEVGLHASEIHKVS